MPRSDHYVQRFIGKTLEIKRPRENDAEYRHMSDSEFWALQEGWDRAHEQHVSIVAIYAQSAAKTATEKAEANRVKAEREAETRARADAAILTPALEQFKRSGGTAEEFEAIKGEILADSRRSAALQAATKVAAEQEPRARYAEL